jgi:hypothetical protein
MTEPTDDEVRALLEGTTPEPWSGHNMIYAEENRQMTPEELGEYVCNAAKLGSPDRFLFVSGKHDDGSVCDVCLTGNGPRGPANTALIAAAPDLARALLASRERERAARAEADTMREAVTKVQALRGGIEADVKSAHQNRGNGVAGWMKEDDREFRSDLKAAFDELEAAIRARGQP